jgi:hypothetical protein
VRRSGFDQGVTQQADILQFRLVFLQIFAYVFARFSVQVFVDLALLVKELLNKLAEW